MLQGWPAEYISCSDGCATSYSRYIILTIIPVTEDACVPRVTLVEAVELLGSFDERLREYAAQRLSMRGIKIVKVS